MKKLLFILLIGLLSSCKGESISSEHSGDFKLELLFEKDGCKMYRFHDGIWVYWSTCEGRTSWVESNGKTSTSHEVNTNIKQP